MSALQKLLGDTLLTKDGERPIAEAIGSAEVVGLYFSAHWCGPCRGFTPVLAETYSMCESAGKPFEVVFVSSDRDEAAFEDYYGEMPWKALPYSNRSLKAKLSAKYNVQGIPSLILLDAEGNIVSKDGRSTIMSDREAGNFPWTPKSFSELLGEQFVGKDGATVGKEAIEGKTLGLYFSAHWCPPCKAFTPKLAATYEKMKARGVDFEFVFISSDNDEAAFKEYHAEMPFLALPFERRADKDALSSMFEVQGIPTLVIVGPDGTVINDEARAAAAKDEEGLNFPWPKPTVTPLDECTAINSSPTVVVLAEACADEVVAATLAGATTVADKFKAAGDEPVVWAFASPGDELATKIRAICSLPAPGEGPVVVLINLQDGKAFFTFEGGDPTADALEAFVAGFTAGALERRELQL